MGACLLLGCACWAVHRALPRWAWPILLVMGLVLATVQYRNYRWRARFDTERADLAKRSEYTTARWLEANLHGGRVYAGGSTGFWLNAFSDTPQLIGCCDEGLSLPVLNEVPARINTVEGRPALEAGINLLRTLGVQALVVNGPASTDVYKDIRAPERFDGVLPLLHRENGDSIYSVLPTGTSLARVIRPGAPATFEWIGSSRSRIRAKLKTDDVVSVQVAWFPGWKATVRGVPRPVTRDALGLLTIRPQCEGDCVIDLAWTGRADRPITAFISLATLVLLASLIYRGRKRAR